LESKDKEVRQAALNTQGCSTLLSWAE
jgi:hypothetical protein